MGLNKGVHTVIRCLVIMAIFWHRASCQSSQNGGSPVSNIAFVAITTDDMQASLKFYTQVLGGMHATELSARYHGDDLYWLLFEKEVTEAQQQSQDPATHGVPDIRDNGNYEVHIEFVVFDNGLMELLQFVPRDGAVSSFPAHEPRTSPAFVSAPHVCFWVQEDVDMNQYIHQMEVRSAELGLTKVKANRPVKVESEAERLAVPVDQLTVPLTGELAGMSFTYFKGPSGEQLELLQTKDRSQYNIGRDYCQRRAVCSGFVSNYTDNAWKAQAGLTGKLNGIFHIGFDTDDLLKSVKFLTEELGANLMRPPFEGFMLKSDTLQNTFFLKEQLDALSQNVAPIDLGVANLSESGNMRLDFRMSLFDNIMVESLMYTDGLTFGEPVFNARFNHSSIAYVNSAVVALMVDDNVDFPSFVSSLESSVAAAGYSGVRFNEIVSQGQDHGHSQGQNPKHATMTSGGLSGLSYAMLTGPGGEHVALVQFKGQSREKVKRALVKYGSVFTGFPETNPWNTGGMDHFCQQYSSSELVGR